MKTFTYRFQVDAPIEQVAAFHRDARVLKKLTPPPLIVQIHQVEPLAEGSIAEFTMWAGPLPIRWRAVHSQVHPGQGFTDRQERGPFQDWVHQHSFTALTPQRTEVSDQVTATPSGHWFWGLVSRLMWLSLPLLFFYRAWQTRRALER
jgi:ligand-binding SRPBCC domain-containing protein